MIPRRQRLGLKEAAELLGVATATLERWVRQGLVVSQGEGARTSFDAEELRKWAQTHGVRSRAGSSRGGSFSEDYLAQAIERGVVLAPSGPMTVVETIETAVSGLAECGALPSSKCPELVEKILERERMASTALGGGVAVPHPREPQQGLVTEPIVALVFADELVDWAAPDHLGVHAAFLLISPNSREHLQVLARLAFAMRCEGFADWLAQHPSKDELVARLRTIHKDA